MGNKEWLDSKYINRKLEILKMMGYEIKEYGEIIEVKLIINKYSSFWVVVNDKELMSDFSIEKIVKEINDIIVSNLNVMESSRFKNIIDKEY